MITSLSSRMFTGSAVATLVCSVDFSSAVLKFGSTTQAAIAIAEYFDAASHGLDCYVHHDSLFSASTPETVAAWEEARARCGLTGVRLGWASSNQPASGVIAWSMMIAARVDSTDTTAVREYRAVLDERTTEELLRFASKTPPVWPRPNQAGAAHRRVISADQTMITLDFVGYTAAVRSASGVPTGRDLLGELQRIPHIPAGTRSSFLEAVFPARVAQQLELEELLVRLDGVASEYNATILSTTLDGGPGSDGRSYGVSPRAAHKLLTELSTLINTAKYPFVAALATPDGGDRGRGVDSCLAWAKIDLSRGGKGLVETPCLKCRGFGRASNSYEQRQARYLAACPNFVPS